MYKLFKLGPLQANKTDDASGPQNRPMQKGQTLSNRQSRSPIAMGKNQNNRRMNGTQNGTRRPTSGSAADAAQKAIVRDAARLVTDAKKAKPAPKRQPIFSGQRNTQFPKYVRPTQRVTYEPAMYTQMTRARRIGSNRLVTGAVQSAARRMKETSYLDPRLAEMINSKSRDDLLVQELATQIALPMTAAGLRWADNTSIEKTATMAVHSYMPMNQSRGNSGTYAAVPPGTWFGFLFRSAFRSSVMFYANPSHSRYTYSAVFTNGVTTALVDTFTIGAKEGHLLPLSWWDDLYAGDSNYIHPHGDRLFPGTSSVSGRSGFTWVDIGATVEFVATVLDVGSFITPVLYTGEACTMLDPILQSATPYKYTFGTVLLPVSVAGYYSFTYTSNTSTATQTLTATLSGIGDVFGHHCAPNVETHAVDLSKVRCLAGAVLVSNMASALNKEGIVYATQYAQTKQWQDNLSQANFGMAANTYCGPLEKGVYGWLKPNDVNDFAFRQQVTSNGGVALSVSFDLDSTSSYIAVSASSSKVAADSYPGLDLLVTTSMAFEFQTNVQLYERETSMYTVEEVTRTIRLLQGLEQFHENPFHFSDIFDFVKKGARYAVDNAGKIGTILSIMFPTLAGPITAATQLVEAVGSSKNQQMDGIQYSNKN